VVRRLGIFWGVEARRPIRAPASVEDLILGIEAALVEDRIAAPGDTIVLVAGVPLREKGNTNVLKLHRIGEGARLPT
jgi:pyruvate kinase